MKFSKCLDFIKHYKNKDFNLTQDFFSKKKLHKELIFGICTLAGKMTSFRKSKTLVCLKGH